MCPRSAKKSYAVSICSGGHATVQLGRVAVYLEIEELRGLMHAVRDVLREYEGAESVYEVGPRPDLSNHH